MKLAVLFIAAIFCLSSSSEKTITGTISYDKYKYGYMEDAFLELKHGNKIVESIRIDSNGHFHIHRHFSQDLDLFFLAIGGPPTYLATIRHDSPDSLDLNLTLPVVYKKNLGKVICPKCGKTDHIIPISYGLQYIIITEKDDTNYSSDIDQSSHDGGCMYDDFSPRWFCKRDKLEF
jgi:hypothetical protein